MAEIGHASMKRNKPLAVVDASWEDVSSMGIQEEELQKFLDGQGKSRGRRPSPATVALEMHKEQRKREKDYAIQFQNGNYHYDADGDDFIPSKKAKHKAPVNYSSSNLTE